MNVRLDIAHMQARFVIAHGGRCRSVIDGDAFDTLADALFEALHAEHRQHVAHDIRELRGPKDPALASQETP
jgi:hypothetical protein